MKALLSFLQSRADDEQLKAEATLVEAWQALYEAKYTGRVYIDFAQGKPKAFQIPSTAVVRLI
jgi:hypothetical protein